MEVIMDIKVGDEVTVLNTSDLNDLASVFIKKFNKYKVVFISEDKIGLEYANGCHARVNISCLGLYETSNRKKLHDHIKASGYTSSELGEAIGNKWQFSNITKKSRFGKFGDISEKSLNDSKLLVESIITGFNKKSDNVETKIDSEFQFSSDEFDFKFDIPEEKSQDAFVFEGNYPSDLGSKKSSGTGASQSNWMTLNKIAFAICFIIVILLISILYFVVSK